MHTQFVGVTRIHRNGGVERFVGNIEGPLSKHHLYMFQPTTSKKCIKIKPPKLSLALHRQHQAPNNCRSVFHVVYKNNSQCDVGQRDQEIDRNKRTIVRMLSGTNRTQFVLILLLSCLFLSNSIAIGNSASD